MLHLKSSAVWCRHATHSMLAQYQCEPPLQTLAELDESLKLLETLQGDLAKTEAQSPLIHEQFSILCKYEDDAEYWLHLMSTFTVSLARCIPSLFYQIKMPVALCAADHNNCAGMQGGKLLICSLMKREMWPSKNLLYKHCIISPSC